MSSARWSRVACILVVCLAIARPAHAYLDPGTGSMIISGVVGVVAAVALALKMYWYRIVGWLRGGKHQLPSRSERPRPADE